MKCEITYLNLVDEALGSALHSLRLLDLGDLLMAGLVVLTMVPYIDVLATIVGAPLDLFHFIVGGRLSFLALCATPNHDRGHHRTITMVRSTLLRGSLYGRLLHRSRGWSPVLIFPHTARWGSPCSFITPCRGARVGLFWGRVLGDPLHRRDSNGPCHGLLWAVCPMVVCSSVTGSVGPEPKIALGSTSEVALHSLIQRITTLELKNFTKNVAILS